MPKSQGLGTLFETIIHCDWSKDPGKRWKAVANLGLSGWRVSGPSEVERSRSLIDDVFELGSVAGPVLVGFDFPIGLPAAFAREAGFRDFASALLALGTGRWESFFDICDAADEIAIERPFYPRSSKRGVTQRALIDGLKVQSVDDLRRRCEMRTPERRAACPLFWTLGANQVGRAAIAGWREFVGPALKRGAALWPFHGSLADLTKGNRVVIAETYPAEAYGHVGIQFRRGQSKRRQSDRASFEEPILRWGASRGVELTDEARRIVEGGFGYEATGEDAFDAFVGLLGMLEVVLGRRGEGFIDHPSVRNWEGWILGQSQ